MWRGMFVAAGVLVLGGGIVGMANAGDAPPSPQPAPPARASKPELPRQKIDLGRGVSFEMVLIPAGEFEMGSPKEESGRLGDEALHRVRITKSFWLGQTEVTQAAWAVVMGGNPSGFQDPTFPATDVSWEDCQAFVNRLNETVPGGGFRLPTEAEWEFACRAGSRTRFCCGTEEKTLAAYAWYEANSAMKLHPVGTLKPNEWGLHDMHGNVWEWCQDWHRWYEVLGEDVAVDPVASEPASQGRVQRGGCWFGSAAHVRSARRSYNVPSFRYVIIGLRLARTVVADAPPPPQVPGNVPPTPPPAPKAPSESSPSAPTDPPTPKPPAEPKKPDAPPTKDGEVPSWAKVAPEQIEAAKAAGVPVAFENSIKMRFVLIPPGTFTMGSPTTEADRGADETPHPVTLTKPYYLAVTEVTNAQYRRFKAGHDSGAYKGVSRNGDDQPVVTVSWDDATAFVGWLNAQDRGRGYRLPTEAEWERACRAGTTGRWSWGEDEAAMGRYANVADRTAKARWPYWPNTANTDDGEAVTARVGHYLPNGYGLFDMHGNVWEWCQDVYGDYSSGAVTDPTGASGAGSRVLRGGSWYYPAGFARSALRARDDPGSRFGGLGLRLATAVTADAAPPQVPGNAPPAPPPAPKPPTEPPPPVASPGKDGEVPSWAKVAPEQIEAAKKVGVPVAFENSIGMRFVLIPAGTFTMGSPTTEEGRGEDETPHEVTLTRPYYLGVTEVTNGQYRRFRADHHSGKIGTFSLNADDQPAVNVSWDETAAFVWWLNRQDRSRTYRLPTEAEWERACRAGSATVYSFGDDASKLGDCAWTDGSSGGKTHPVGTLKPNAWGLYDTHGSAWESCEDWYADYPTGAVTDPTGASGAGSRVLRGGSAVTDLTGAAGSGDRVIRGGSWDAAARDARSASRDGCGPGLRFVDLGLRLAVTGLGDALPAPAPGSEPPAPSPAPKAPSESSPSAPTDPPTPKPPAEPKKPVAPPTKDGELPSWVKVAPEQLEAAKKAGVPVAFENSIGMRFVLVPAGTFTMGSPEGEKGRERDEAQHRVTLTQPFYMSMCETTNEEFRRYEPGHQSPTFMGESLGEDRLPVVNVESGDAVAFAGWLSLREANWTYRLPTEAEWEYSARAGTGTRWYSGSDTTGLAATANISDLRAKKMFHMGWAASWDDGYAMAAPVGSFAPNPWGLYDTIGNVWELCADWFAPYSSEATIDPSGPASGSARVVRGGSWWLSPVQSRVAYRGAIPPGGPGAWRSICGFRLVASRRSPR